MKTSSLFHPLPRLRHILTATSAAALLAVCSPALMAETEAPASTEEQPLAAPIVQPNAQMQAVLDMHAAMKPKPIETLDPKEARKQPSIGEAAAALAKKLDKKVPEKVGDVKNSSFANGDAKIKVRIYTPEGSGPFPTVLYIHGGGWVLADLDSYDASARALCNAVQAVVVATDYRHAPEARFPAAHDDVLSAYKWTLNNAREYKGDPTRIALVGESAGGNMAASVSLMIAREGLPRPLHQVLVYPVTDLSRMDTVSYEQNAEAKPLNKGMMMWFTKHVLKTPADATDPVLSVALAGEALKESPPTTIITAQIDPLRSDGDKLAVKLQEQGIIVVHKNFEGVTHEFFGMGAVVDAAKEAMTFAAGQLTSAFAQKVTMQ